MNELDKSLSAESNLDKILGAWANRGIFPHAILIEGMEGTGKKDLADYIASMILCESDNRPCGICSHCVKVQKGIHPDILFYDSEGGTKSFHVDKVREIRKESWIMPNDAKQKVIVLNNTQDMTISAQNALLKIIEEPPNNVHFILICENKNTMLTTIRSRVTSISTSPSEEKNVRERLEKELPSYGEKEYNNAIKFSDGNLGLAKQYLSTEKVRASYDMADEIWKSFKNKDVINAIAKVSNFERNKEGFISQLIIIRGFATKELLSVAKKTTRDLSLLQLSKIVDIIDEITISVNFNVNMLILTTVFVDRISSVISS